MPILKIAPVRPRHAAHVARLGALLAAGPHPDGEEERQPALGEAERAQRPDRPVEDHREIERREPPDGPEERRAVAQMPPDARGVARAQHRAHAGDGQHQADLELVRAGHGLELEDQRGGIGALGGVGEHDHDRHRAELAVGAQHPPPLRERGPDLHRSLSHCARMARDFQKDRGCRPCSDDATTRPPPSWPYPRPRKW